MAFIFFIDAITLLLNLLFDCPRRWSELFDLLHHVRQWHDFCYMLWLLAKSYTIQYERTLQQLNTQRWVNTFRARLRTRTRHMTLIRSMEGVKRDESFLESAVAVIGGIAIGLG